MSKTLHFPKSSGLNPRPFDNYDDMCLRLYLAKGARITKVERELRDWGSDDLDWDYTHGRDIYKNCRVTND